MGVLTGVETGRVYSQLLKVTVGNVMATPVRDGVELDAVGELHLVLFLEPLALPGPLLLVPLLGLFCVASRGDVAVVAEFEGFAFTEGDEGIAAV